MSAVPQPPSECPSAAKQGGGGSPLAWLSGNGPALVVLHLFIILLISWGETRGMWESPFLLWGHSAWFDAQRTVELGHAFRAGEWFPGWVPDFYYGHGSPMFQVYAPLVYYVTAFASHVGLTLAAALKATQVALLLASGLAMYWFVAARLSLWAACLASALYLLAPYRCVDMLHRHALAEHFAFVWLPLIALGTERFASKSSRLGLFTGSFATAGLVLTHNISAMIGLPACVFAGWLLSGASFNWRTAARAVLPSVLGVAISAWFWQPALSARPLLHAESSLTGGYFDFHRNFAEWRNFIAFGVADPGVDLHGVDPVSLQAGIPHLLLAAAALCLVALPKNICGAESRRWGLAGAGIMAASLFMSCRASSAVWEALPLLKYVQFPWRFLELEVFGAALCGAAVMHQISTADRRMVAPAFGIVFAALWMMCEPEPDEVRFMAADLHSQSLRVRTADDLQVPNATQNLVSLETFMTPETIRSSGSAATSGDDFLPLEVTSKPTALARSLIEFSDGNARGVSKTSLNGYRADVRFGSPGTAILQQFYFQGWQATVDGVRVPVHPFGPEGLVACSIPAGSHSLEFRYQALASHGYAFVFSAISLVIEGLVLCGIAPKTRATV